MKLIKIAFLFLILIANSYLCNAFEVIEGEIIEITGPDDMNLDPQNTIIAVDSYGNGDSIVNDVEFFTDRDGLGSQTAGEGMVEKDGVSITTTTTHFIDNWSNGANGPAFTGLDADSAANLSEIMRDIRWSAAPSPVSIDIAGLVSGSIYNVKLLFNEGADRNRGWDIAVNDELVVDNITSEGGDGFWTPENSFVYSGDFTATDDGVIAVTLQNDIGGAAQVAADGNPILQGIVLSSTMAPDDEDEDGLPDAWEEALVDNLEDLDGNASGPGPGPGTGDFDGDGLTDLDEYEETKTDPTKKDMDEDGLSDGVETNTGTYVSATNTGTDPKKADTDGDGLLDGVETNTGKVIDNDDTGTDPNMADTDEDGHKDRREIDKETDPNDPLDFPAFLGELAYKIEQGTVGNQNYTGALGMDFTVQEPIRILELGAFDSGANGLMRPITVTMWDRNDQGTPGFADDSGDEILGEVQFIEENDGELRDAHRMIELDADLILEAGSYTIIASGYGVGEPNGNVGTTGMSVSDSAAITFVGGSRFGDDTLAWPTQIDGGPVNRYAAGTFSFEIVSDDEDNDGIPDFWEEKYGVDDPEGDPDNDGLTNLEEYELRTKPDNKDTDGDGLEDGDEKTAGLNPTSKDTDNDGLDDNQEIAQGTNPTKSDTDNDGIADGLDLDPLDPTVSIDSGTQVLVGKVMTFSGPDDLNFEPSTAVIAVDVYGNADSTINGVQFFSDRAGLGDNVTDEGVVEKDGVTVRTTSTHQIDNWSSGGGGPAFAGADADSVANLSEVMRDIRWSAAPSPLDIEMEGLIAGGLYEIQLLFNEGADRNRGWDITVNDDLVVDNITSEGLQDVHTWTPSSSAAYVANFTATDSGTLSVSMQNDIGGLAQVATDGNPILQGIVVHLAVPPAPFEITDISVSDGIPTITFNSIPGRVYAVDSFEYNEDDQTYFWVELDDGLESNGTETSYTDEFVDRDLRVNLYRVREIE